MMDVGLWDSTFAHDICSTAWKTPAHLRYVRWPEDYPGVTLFTDGFIASDVARDVRARVKIGWLHEPPCLYPDVYAAAYRARHHFETILTYRANLLELPGFTFMPYAGVWIERDDWGLHPKTRLVSQLVGAKRATEGHRIRHAVAAAVHGLGVDFYGEYGTPVDYSIATKLRVLRPYAFSIVAECCREPNLFTEILLDCFALGTVPVFWGCPNVGEFFNADGMLCFETPEACARIVRGLSFELYAAMRPAVEDNLARVAEYAVAEDWMYTHILRAYDH